MTSTLWLTGLSGSGKTTIAYELSKIKVPIIVLDGDRVRQTLSKDLKYTKEERDKHITRVADVCRLINESNVDVIVSVISPTRKIRRYARDNIKNFIEVYVKCPIDVCKKRDVKGMYKKALAGKIKDFVGVNIPYEEPEHPEIIVETDEETVKESVGKILEIWDEY